MCAPFQHEDMPTLHGPFLTTNALSGHAKVWRDLRCPELYWRARRPLEMDPPKQAVGRIFGIFGQVGGAAADFT